MRDEKDPVAAADEAERADRSDEGRSRLADVASSIVDAAGPMLAAARRVIDERPGARVRRVRRMGQQPLTNLWDDYPEAQRASIRDIGLRTIPVDAIKGTAVAGPGQRGGDFLPLRNRRSDDWRSRWQRILNSQDRLDALPPIEAIKFGDAYWVVDGHNRVAAALYNGQGDVDAVVQELRLPGRRASDDPPSLMAGVLEGSLDLRAAGEGRLTRTADRPLDLESARQHEHTDDADEAGR